MTLNEVRTKIVKLVEKHTNVARKLHRDFLEPNVEFFNKSRRAGWARYHTHTVAFNEVIARDNWSDFENTVIHEIAHLLTRRLFPYAKQHHGPEFRRVMYHMGWNGKTYHNYDVSSVVKARKPQKKYVYSCACDQVKHYSSGIKHSKISSGVASYRCLACKTIIKYTGKSMT